MKRTNKLSIPKLLVGSTDTALVNNTALVGASNALAISNGQLGVLSWDYSGTPALGTCIAPGVLPTAVSQIKVIQGTPASSNMSTADNVFRVNDPALIESGIIARDKIISFSAKRYKIPTYGAVALTGFAATATANTQYGFYTELISQTNDRDNSDNDNVLSTVIETPDWGGTGGVFPTSTRDWVLQNLASNLNSRSKAVRSSYGTGAEDVIVFGLNSSGGSATGNNANAATFGGTIPGAILNVQTINGNTSTFTVDQAFVQMMAQIRIANTIPAAATWEVIDLSTAGAASKIDVLLVVGLPRTRSAYYDNIEQLYPNVKVNPGFAYQPTLAGGSLITTTRIPADEGTGQGWKLRNANDLRNQLFVHTMQTQPMGEWFSQGKEYIDETANYHQYILEYYDTENTINSEVISPKQLTIIVPSAVTTVANTNPRTTLESTLGVWLQNCVTSGFSSIQLKGAATSSTYFVN